MKETKTVLHRFDFSSFDEELGFLNEMSEKGWQLARMRIFTQEYVRDDRAAYRYAIDFQQSLSAYDFSQYREEFEDRGWAYVTNRGGWYVFRRPYDPALPEEAYLLYSDEPSFRDMKTRVGFAVDLVFLMYLPSMLRCFVLSYLILMAFCLLFFVDSIARRHRFRKIRRAPKPYRFHLYRYSTLPLLLLFSLIFVFLPSKQDLYMQGQAVGMQSEQFTMNKPDFVALNMLTYSSKDAEEPLRPVFILTDESGRTVDSGLMDPNGKPTNEFLRAGTYTLTVDWDAALAPGEEAEDNRTSCLVYLTGVSLLPETDAFYIAWIVWILASFAVVIIVACLTKKV